MARLAFGREWMWRAFAVAVLYAGLAYFAPVAAVSLAAGLAVGCVYRWGWRISPALLIGSLAATSLDLSLDEAVVTGVVRTGAAVVATALLTRSVGDDAAWPSPNQIRNFVASLAIPAVAVAMTDGASVETWLAATLGGLVGVPAVALATDEWRRTWTTERITRVAATAVIGLATLLAALAPSSAHLLATQALLFVVVISMLFVSGFTCAQARKVRTLESSVALLEGRAGTPATAPQPTTDLAHFEWVLNTDAFEWSPELRRLFGVANAAPTITLQAVRGRIHPEDRRRFDDALAQARADGEAFSLDVRVILPNRDIRWLRARCRADLIAGRVVRLHGTCEDLTDTKMAEQRVRAHEQQTTQVIDASSECFVTTDRFDRILEWNRHAETTFGWKRTEVVGRSFVDLIVPEADRVAYRSNAELGVRRELTAVHHDGRAFPIELVAWSTTDEDEDVFFHAFMHDISERLADKAAVATALDEAREASRLKSAFLANTSHEIRTPMNGVMGMVELLKTSPLDDTQRAWLSTMEASASSLGSIIDDILDVSKIEANKLEIEDSEYALGEVVRATVASFEPAAASKGIRVAAVVKPSTPDAVRGDPVRVRQVLSNLVSNAVKFTDEGSVTVTVSMKSKRLRFEVCDTGAGIAADQQDRLFDPFVQLDGSNTRRHGGTGLGLAICRELVKLMSGEIGVDSTVGKGATFWFTLPAVVVTPPRPAPAPEPKPAASGRVLVVEDNAVNRMVATQLLKQLGYTTEVAEDGLVAVQACETSQYDAILMDCQMPNMDGFEATLAIRAMKTGAAHTPIIAVTASAMMEDRDRCTEVGMDGFVSKPIAKDALAETLERCILKRNSGRSRARRGARESSQPSDASPRANQPAATNR